MADRIEEDDATIAAGFSDVAGNFSFSAPQGEVAQIDVVVPNGHANQTGLAIVYSGMNVVPKKTGKWVSGNDRTYKFPVDNLPTGDGWSWVGFNVGSVSHTFHVYFHVNEIVEDVQQLPPVMLLPAGPWPL